MSIADYRIVLKPFSLDNAEKLLPDQVVDVTSWRNVRGLENCRYLRRPITEDDYELIGAAIMGVEENSVPIKRGRPPKNGGEE